MQGQTLTQNTRRAYAIRGGGCMQGQTLTQNTRRAYTYIGLHANTQARTHTYQSERAHTHIHPHYLAPLNAEDA